MKHIITITLGIVAFTSCSPRSDAIKFKTEKEGMPMPSFTMMKEDTTLTFSSDSISRGNTSFIMFFSPTCPYCRMQTRRIISSTDELKNVQFVFVTEKQNLPYLKKFRKDFETNKIKRFTITIDTGHAFYDYFRPIQIPFTAIYDNEKKLKQVYLGAMSKKRILEATRL